ncbi:MAG: AMP-binding protein [Deltaproteobacteria bacterium]|nr:AMP-binding protein [Deltaproteobacteria bacterium]
MGAILRLNAARFPSKLAVKDEERSLTYADLNARACALAAALQGLGVKKGDPVAICLPTRVEHVELLLAAAKIGAVAIPLDVKWREVELRSVLRALEPRVVVSEEVHLAQVEAAGIPAGRCLVVGAASGPGRPAYEALARERAPEPEADVGEDDLFLVMITSGTTGFPKACMASHRTFFYRCLNRGIDKGLSADDVTLLVMPLYFNAGRVSVVAGLCFGGTVVLRRRFDPVEALRAVEAEGVTATTIVPTICDRLLEGRRECRASTDSLRYLGITGAALHRRTIEGLLRSITPYVYLAYASTDTGQVTTLRPEDQLTRFGSSGQVVWGIDVQLVDEAGRPVPRGEVGEVTCRGPSVHLGYYRNEEATRAAFRDGWFFTGDLGRFDEQGYLYIVGRRKSMIKTGGISVFPEEIEGVLHTHPKVGEAAVVGVPHPAWGEAIRAVVVLRPGEVVTEQDLIEFCKGRLAPYKAPKAVEFVETLPRTESGKVAKERLRARYAPGGGDGPAA